ncbi:hypothetical protein QMK19_39625 [Streptomyces sp. H10-C2]|nr:MULTISPECIES: hypothetical protein [unclassified Streptomyces]MDJ0347302.1 hypothetical protein [Streptomyces sp. PH10-H1]MDJ0375536.1 hypothetical protein [Streptomyces sp. H10-C2]
MSYRSKLRGALVGAGTAALVTGTGLLALPARAEVSDLTGPSA